MGETTNTETIVKGTALIIRPEKVPCKKDMILDHEEFRNMIQGNLQIMKCKNLGVAFVFNKDRDALRLPLNRVVFSRDQKYRFMLYGTFMVVGIDGDLNYTGLTREQLRYFKTRFHVPARMAMVDGKPEVVFDLLAR